MGEGIFVNLVSWTGLFYHTRRLSPGWDTGQMDIPGGLLGGSSALDKGGPFGEGLEWGTKSLLPYMQSRINTFL